MKQIFPLGGGSHPSQEGADGTGRGPQWFNKASAAGDGSAPPPVKKDESATTVVIIPASSTPPQGVQIDLNNPQDVKWGYDDEGNGLDNPSIGQP